MEDIIIALIFIVVLIVLAYFVLKKLSTKANSDYNQLEMGNRNANAQNINDNNELTRFEQNNNNVANNNTPPVIDPNKNYTKKELHKMEKKKVKADAREQMEEYLKQKKLREIEKERDYLEKEHKRKEEESKEEEIVRKVLEEKEKKEAEEYAKWEKMFEINEEGEEKEEFNDNVITEFINYVKLRKVVSLEDLAGTFKISSSEAVARLKELESAKRICGIVDDRGKYIYLTEKELLNIEKFISNKGRISKAELVDPCNKLIKFEPTDEDKEIIAQQNLDILKGLEEKDGKDGKQM